MSRSIAEVASGASRIAGSITDVVAASDVSTEGVNQSKRASTEVARTAEQLRALVATFRM
jgi:methyl-accepting chemotaxis protein